MYVYQKREQQATSTVRAWASWQPKLLDSVSDRADTQIWLSTHMRWTKVLFGRWKMYSRSWDTWATCGQCASKGPNVLHEIWYRESREKEGGEKDEETQWPMCEWESEELPTCTDGWKKSEGNLSAPSLSEVVSALLSEMWWAKNNPSLSPTSPPSHIYCYCFW